MDFCRGSVRVSLVVLFCLAMANALEGSNCSYHTAPLPGGHSLGPAILQLPELPQLDLQLVVVHSNGNRGSQPFQEV